MALVSLGANPFLFFTVTLLSFVAPLQKIGIFVFYSLGFEILLGCLCIFICYLKKMEVYDVFQNEVYYRSVHWLRSQAKYGRHCHFSNNQILERCVFFCQSRAELDARFLYWSGRAESHPCSPFAVMQPQATMHLRPVIIFATICSKKGRRN